MRREGDALVRSGCYRWSLHCCQAMHHRCGSAGLDWPGCVRWDPDCRKLSVLQRSTCWRGRFHGDPQVLFWCGRRSEAFCLFK